jgi:hypothetical protein
MTNPLTQKNTGLLSFGDELEEDESLGTSKVSHFMAIILQSLFRSSNR